jgi:hypothetical protein
MLLNRVPVLDKGYVALLDSSNTTQKLRDIGIECFNTETYPTSLEELGTLTILIKCPLFLVLNLAKFDFKIIYTKFSAEEAYIPNAAEISASDMQISEEISDDINRTTEALLINPKAYIADGCDRFTSQVLTPINTYTTVIVHGSYLEWISFCSNQKKSPTQIESYQTEILNIIRAEWK